MFMYATQVNGLSIVPIFQVQTFFCGSLYYTVESFVISTYVVVDPVWESVVQLTARWVYIAAGYGTFLWFIGVFTSQYSWLGTCDLVEATIKRLLKYGKSNVLYVHLVRDLFWYLRCAGSWCRFVLVRSVVFSD
jgi:hypothetical protein